MNSWENFGWSWSARTMAALSSRIISDFVIAVTVAMRRGWPVRQPSPKKFLALLGNHGDLALAVHDVKDSICRISLAEDCFILSIVRYGPSPVGVGKERLKNEGLLPLGQGSALDTCRVRA
jgi:hypothetical protein